MERAYLPGNVRQWMQELMKEHKITQAQLATCIGSTESAISRFVSGKTDKISTEHLLRIAKVFEVSTDFLLGKSTHLSGQILILKNWACRCRLRGIYTPGKPMRRSSTACWKARALQKSPT